MSNKDNRLELVRLITENPDLPVVAKVDSEIVARDESAWWIADIGKPFVDEYFDDDYVIWVKSLDFQDLVERYIEEYYEDNNPILPDSVLEEIAEAKVESYPWYKEAIILPIEI